MKKQMAIFFNGELQSAPNVNEPITGGHAQITGGGNSGFSHDEAKQMVDLLNAGALPVPAKIIEEKELTKEKMNELFLSLTENDSERHAIEENAKLMAVSDAKERIADIVISLIK